MFHHFVLSTKFLRFFCCCWIIFSDRSFTKWNNFVEWWKSSHTQQPTVKSATYHRHSRWKFATIQRDCMCVCVCLCKNAKTNIKSCSIYINIFVASENGCQWWSGGLSKMFTHVVRREIAKTKKKNTRATELHQREKAKRYISCKTMMSFYRCLLLNEFSSSSPSSLSVFLCIYKRGKEKCHHHNEYSTF